MQTTPVRSQGRAIALAITTLRNTPSTLDEATRILAEQRAINRTETYHRDQQVCLLLIRQREEGGYPNLPAWLDAEAVADPNHRDVVRCVAAAHQRMIGRAVPAPTPADTGTSWFPCMRVNELATAW